MDEKRQILLGSKDILSRSIEDLYINLNLGSTFSELRDGKVENIFDVQAQFKKERNTSRDFRVYGLIDSTVTDSDNLNINVYNYALSGTGITSGVTTLSGFVTSIISSPIVYGETNAYGFKRGKFLLELTGYTNDFVYLQIPSNGVTYTDQIYSQQLIFRDADGVFMDYGTQTIEVDENGNAITIDNNFYFLYNKHWVKQDLSITETKQSKVYLSAVTNIVNVSETNTPGVPIAIVLDKPSPFGLESVTLLNQSSTLSFNEINITDSLGNSYPLPYTFNFATGEQFKNLFFNSPTDTLQEFTESVTLGLDNFQSVQTGSPLSFIINVADSTPRNIAVFSFQNVYQNRNYFTGIVKNTGGYGYDYSYPTSSVVRNGLFYEGTPLEFYPSDNFDLSIQNLGDTTVLPVNNTLGILAEQVFTAGQSINFNVNLQYQNIETHSIKFYFLNNDSRTNTAIPYTFSNTKGLTINSIPIIDYYQGYKVDFNTFLNCLNGQPTIDSAGTNIRIDGWNRYGLEVPFNVTSDATGLTITITAKNPGTRLDINAYGSFPDIFNASDPILQTFGITAETIQNFVYSAQNSLDIVLSANKSNNTHAQYLFTASKIGFKTMQFFSSELPASTVGTQNYLVSSYNNILRNYQDIYTNPLNANSSGVIYYHSGVTSNWSYSSAYDKGLYSAGDTYVNGLLFLANKFFDNTINTSYYTTGGNSLNNANFGNAAGDYFADFLPTAYSVLPETSEYLSPVTTEQVGWLWINFPYSTLPSNVSSVRSFDFRTGSTDAYLTYVLNNGSRADIYANSGYITSTGGTPGKSHASPYTTLGDSVYGLPGFGVFEANTLGPAYGPQALGYLGFGHGDIYSYLKLTELTAGVPFEVTNLIDFRYSSGANAGDDYLPITLDYLTIQPNTIAGVTINMANNYMGGYSLTRPIVPLAVFAISFVSGSITAPINAAFTVVVSLSSPSVNGNESTTITIGGSAVIGSDFTAIESYPLNLTWAVGEQNKTLHFQNIKPFNPFMPSKTIVLNNTNISNALQGIYSQIITLP